MEDCYRMYIGIVCVVIVLSMVYYILYGSPFLEGFVGETIPDVCGTAGFKPSSATINYLKSLGTDMSDRRVYTPSECNKLDDGTWNERNGGCYKLKKKENGFQSESNIDMDYGEKCKGLNIAMESTYSSECMIDGKPAGKPNEAYSVTEQGKDILIEKNTFRFYTKNECDLLKGTFNPLTDPKAIQVNGKDYGFCQVNNMSLSYMCTRDEKSMVSTAAKAVVKDAAKDAIKDMLI